MSHIIIFSDLHLHSYEPFAHIDPETSLNSRLLDGIGVLQQIRQYCLKNKIKIVLNGGDLLHKGASVTADVLEVLIKELTAFSLAGIEFVTVVGQHDFLRRDGEYNLPKALSPLMTVLNYPGEYRDRDKTLRVIGCSYRDGVWNLKEALRECGKSINTSRSNILLGHFMVQEILKADGAKFDVSNYVSLSDFPEGLQWIFLGDYHVALNLPEHQITSIGATHHHTFGTHNRPQGGFLDLDLDTMTFKRIETKAPMFVKLESGDGFPGKYDRKNFYAIPVHNTDEQDKIKARLKGDWNVTFPGILTEEEEIEFGTETNVSVTMEPTEVVYKYVEHFGLNEEYLKKGLEFIQ